MNFLVANDRSQGLNTDSSKSGRSTAKSMMSAAMTYEATFRPTASAFAPFSVPIAWPTSFTTSCFRPAANAESPKRTATSAFASTKLPVSSSTSARFGCPWGAVAAGLSNVQAWLHRGSQPRSPAIGNARISEGLIHTVAFCRVHSGSSRWTCPTGSCRARLRRVSRLRRNDSARLKQGAEQKRQHE